jgi:outer membrane lipoprotein-sorting protein
MEDRVVSGREMKSIRVFAVGFLLAALVSLPASKGEAQSDSITPLRMAAASSSERPMLSAEERAILSRVSARLNRLTTLKGRFLQLAPDGSTSEGDFYLRRPKRLRFEYESPNPLLIVADGTYLLVQDRKLDTLDRYPIGMTPLSVLLRSDIDLIKDKSVRRVKRERGLVFITAREEGKESQGEITLVFEEPEMTLRQWEVIDAQGRKTLIALSDHKYGMTLGPELFAVEEPERGANFSHD